MVTPLLEQKLQDYRDTYEQLKGALKWKVSDQRTLMMVASMYVVNNKSFDLQQFLKVSDYIKDNVGAFNTLKSTPRFTIGAMLDVYFDEPEKKFHELIEIYDQMVDERFSRGASTYLAAQVLLGQREEGKDIPTDRVMKVYKGMSSHHFFLTSSTDYPLAVLLAGREGTVDEIMDHVEHFYKELSKNGLSKGNDLQFMSHILSIDHETKPDELIQQSIKVYDTFKTLWKRPKGIHYPLVGLLALLKDGEDEVSTVLEAFDRLGSEKPFRWHKDMNLIMAANLTISEKLDNPALLGTGIYAAVDAIIQAQQAAMIAAISAATVVNSSGDGGS
ncbi:DUF4003 family protein [Fictibacillus fluitans]|uniref:DUF4003 family protein n=1 Tax=Fictibacillus fluitans TaxID=3058422 RepID=A0ABT8HYZ7_9BACL|nr:DUF4003 family protein [Fictibacillus sp. NE201]MDN4525997.1 DUF4003 family protein [Fictibacillus sp. NE201]